MAPSVHHTALDSHCPSMPKSPAVLETCTYIGQWDFSAACVMDTGYLHDSHHVPWNGKGNGNVSFILLYARYKTQEHCKNLRFF